MEVYRTNPQLFIKKSEVLKALGHPQRLCIVKMLCERDGATVTDMQGCLDEAQPTVSQHLSKLKASRIIAGTREGTSIIYSLYDEETHKVVEAIIKDLFD